MTDRNVVHLLYFLHLLAPFTAWLLAIVAVIIGMVKGSELSGSDLGTHVRWLSRTFWFGVLWMVVCGFITFILVITLVGILIWWLPWTILFLWYLYRVIKGWLRLNDGLPMDGAHPPATL
jgi:uncharacterized membrane protein